MENSLEKNYGVPSNISEHKKENSVLELFNLSEEQKRELKERVREHNGLVRVFIHPIPSLQDGIVLENQDRVSQILIKTMFSEKAPPVIIFENARMKGRWKKSLEKAPRDLPKEIYLVSTQDDIPDPKDGIEQFVKFLDEMSVKKIMVGGTSLEVLHYHLNRCVGNFIHLMRRNSDIELKFPTQRLR